MRKTLGDYNIEKSSSSDVNNISWSHKKSNDDKKPKKKKISKKSQIPPGTNIIYKKNEDEKINTYTCSLVMLLRLTHIWTPGTP